ncbi:MAG: hypothetical protein JSV19_06970 [Phycisphaerales bacterium]|nr:MAG: hypothetical protein JSV19_06970 [Phycisphaerales bacterium]
MRHGSIAAAVVLIVLTGGSFSYGQIPPPYTVTPILFVPDPNSFPVGYQPTPGELAADVDNITVAMERIRVWYGQAQGLATSFDVQPTVHMAAWGGLADYQITWTDPENRYTDGISLGNVWGLVGAEVSSRGYSTGTYGAPRVVVVFCKGAGGYAGGAQWFGVGGGRCMLGDWCLDSLADRVPPPYWSWWTGVDRQTGATAHEMGHTIGIRHTDQVTNPVTGVYDKPYTVMWNWWDWPTYPVNPADPTWPLTGLHAWAINDGPTGEVTDYQDVFLLAYRTAWFSTLGDYDCDGDGDVTLDDYVCLDDCLTGPGGGLLTDCYNFDLDDDNDVDLADFAAFQRAFAQ